MRVLGLAAAFAFVAFVACGSSSERPGYTDDTPDAGAAACEDECKPSLGGALPSLGGDAAPDVHGSGEICGNGLDDDGNGKVDDGCSCSLGATQACYPGPAAVAGVGPCVKGTQQCSKVGEFPAWGDCTGAVLPVKESCNQIDDDCNGKVDDLDGCVVVQVPVNIDGDCVTASCPANAPYPIGCNISMAGNDTRGCVANAPASSTVFFKEGDKCGVGRVTGSLLCASLVGAGLNAQNCPMNKSQPFYPPNAAGCP